MATRDQQFARKVIERDKCCQECGRIENLQAHHIIPISEDGPDDPANGIALCASCHADRHPDVPRNLFLNGASGISPPAPWNATSLAAELGRCKRTITRAAKALEIPKLGAQWAFYEEDKQAIKDWLKHYTQSLNHLPRSITIPALADALGHTDHTVLIRAIEDGHLKAELTGKIYFIRLSDARQALESGIITGRSI